MDEHCPKHQQPIGLVILNNPSLYYYSIVAISMVYGLYIIRWNDMLIPSPHR
ncbi:hypothetical protein HMPREF1870_02011 [Bacteroidales bacterium KA00344]|nr:hypothetical protein HMPREF1870_02011 [Bacteroidales bacterium KA00344]